MTLRQRIQKAVSVKSVKVLDAFPKVDDACCETSPVGGTVSVLAYILMVWLLISETSYFLHSKIIYKFMPDNDFDAKLDLRIDITVAMPCPTVGADILDSTHQSLYQFGELQEEDTWFELEPEQRRQFETMQTVNSHLREGYHQIHEFLWRSSSPNIVHDVQPRKRVLNIPYDACRIYGTLTLNKVAGNFHITAGKSIQLPRGHVHIAAFISDSAYNFSHRINHWSFGEASPGIVHPLEGDEKITSNSMMLYQYFMDVVPTEVETFLTSKLAYQYSVKDHERPIDHHGGSHGTPGIFFKYDMSPLKVRVLQERDSVVQFIVKLCATIGGIHVTSGLVNSLVLFVISVIRGESRNSIPAS